MRTTHLLLITSLLALAIPAVAEQELALTDSIVRYTRIDLLLSADGLGSDESTAEIHELAIGLDEFYTSALYDRYRARPVEAALLNFVSGGMGSLLMGDLLFGAINQMGMAISLGLSIAAIPLQAEIGQALAIAGQIGGVVFTVSGTVTPFLYASNYNRILADALDHRR